MGEQTYGKGLIQSLKSLGEDSGIAITVASYLTPKGNNIQGQGITPDNLLELPDASEYGSSDDKWVRNAELFLESLLEKEKGSIQTTEFNNEEIKA
jgi:carboxyl-terminal processing protease